MTNITDPRRPFRNYWDRIEEIQESIKKILKDSDDREMVLFTLLNLAKDLSQDEHRPYNFIDLAVKWNIYASGEKEPRYILNPDRFIKKN